MGFHILKILFPILTVLSSGTVNCKDLDNRKLTMESFAETKRELRFNIFGEMNDDPAMCQMPYSVALSDGKVTVTTYPEDPMTLCYPGEAADALQVRISKLTIDFGVYALWIDQDYLGDIEYGPSGLHFLPVQVRP